MTSTVASFKIVGSFYPTRCSTSTMVCFLKRRKNVLISSRKDGVFPSTLTAPKFRKIVRERFRPTSVFPLDKVISLYPSVTCGRHQTTPSCIGCLPRKVPLCCVSIYSSHKAFRQETNTSRTARRMQRVCHPTKRSPDGMKIEVHVDQGEAVPAHPSCLFSLFS